MMAEQNLENPIEKNLCYRIYGQKGKPMRTYDEKAKALLITAHYSDFDGDLQKWKNSFYEVWRYQMTWSFAYRIEIIDGTNGVFISLLIRPDYETPLMATLEDLGYRKVTKTETSVGIVDYYGRKELENIEELYIDC